MAECRCSTGLHTACNVCKPDGFKSALSSAKSVCVWVAKWNEESSAYVRVSKKQVREIMKGMEDRSKDPIPSLWQFREGYNSTLYFGG